MNTQDTNFAYKIRHALNEKLEDLPESVTERLSKSRQMAVQRKKKEAAVPVVVFEHVCAGNKGGASSRSSSRLGNFGLSLSALVLVIGMIGIFHYEEQRQIQETADIDVAVLTDELPPSAYADNGFKQYLEWSGV